MKPNELKNEKEEICYKNVLSDSSIPYLPLIKPMSRRIWTHVVIPLAGIVLSRVHCPRHFRFQNLKSLSGITFTSYQFCQCSFEARDFEVKL